MIRIHGKLKEKGLRTGMILQVHDELGFEVPEDELEEVEAMVRECMETVLPMDVPLKVDCGAGSNWMDAKG